MARVVSKKAEAPKAPQLLDTKSDYNNYSNLSYFISQYKRAVEIINECETFYSNFLRNKLLTKTDIKHTPGINLLNMRFNIAEFAKNANDLYTYYAYKVLREEFKENLTKYQITTNFKEKYDSCGCAVSMVPDGFTIKACNGGIPMGKYFSYLIDTFCDGRWIIDRKPKKHYEWQDKYFDKVLARSLGYKGKYDTYVEGFSKTDDNTGRISIGNGKYVNVKTVDLERYIRKTKWGGKDTWESSGEFDTFILFGEEELKMIEILKRFNKEHFKVKKDILLNPEKYVDLWREYVTVDKKFVTDDLKDYGLVKKNGKYIVPEPGSYVVHHQNLDSKSYHRFMFAPVDYTYGETGWYTPKGKKRGSTYDEMSGMTYFKEGKKDTYYVGDYSIDGVKFLNKELLQAQFDGKKVRGFEKHYGSKRGDDFFLNRRKLQLQIEAVHPETTNAIDKNADLLLDDGWYYVLIDNTPYQFSNNLSDVDIEWDEEENVLKCEYEYETRRKKAPWPGWLPWVVTTHYYNLEFDCTTNEPLSYDYSYSQVEEKCRE